MVTLEDLLQAYFVCRKSKRRTASAAVYEMDYERRLIALRDRINSRTYAPGKSICFVVTRPRYREVFAAHFEDRIVHTYMALKLEPLFEQIFSPRTFNCRVGKGQLYGINTLANDIRECSENYTADCYILKLDLSGFFMSIPKHMLAVMVDKFIVENYQGEDIGELRNISELTIMHSPELNCERHSPLSFWDRLPANKSLFTNGEGLGMPIGNLPSQILANYLLNDLDWYLEELGLKYHGRYVDDFYCIHKDKQLLLSAMPKIRAKLAQYGLKLNQKKFYIQHYSKGVEFTGAVVKPGRIYSCNRNIANFRRAVKHLNEASDIVELQAAVDSVNSYIGVLRHQNEYHNRRKIISLITPEKLRYLRIKGDYKCVSIKREYRQRAETLKRIRDGTYWEDCTFGCN